MADNEELDEDLFADLYEGDDVSSKPSQPPPAAAPAIKTEPDVPIASSVPIAQTPQPDQSVAAATSADQDSHMQDGPADTRPSENGGWDGGQANGVGNGNGNGNQVEHEDNYGPIGIKEDG